MRTLIKRARLIDPGRADGIADILIEDDTIADIRFHDPDLNRPDSKGEESLPGGENAVADRVIDASGLIAAPGLIDMHVHLREPGEEYKETVESGCRAAAHGGFTAVCPMANTRPVNDSREVTEFIIAQAVKAGMARVYPVAALSRGLKGENLCEYGELKAAGAVALSDDGHPVVDPQLMRKAMEYAKGFDLLIISHCEELSLVAGGAMNEGALATRMGLAGIPNVSESIMVMRDIALAELTGARLHIAHVSTAESVEALRIAKRRGIRVTAETAPHYFTLTEDAVKGYDTHAKMNPPLRSEKDREAVRAGLADGTLDVIASDHAPHSVLEKEVEFDRAANGIIGLETSLPLGLELVREGVLSIESLIEKMAINPARILGFDNHLSAGNPADITLIDSEKAFSANARQFCSLSRNTPFDGRYFTGKAVLTMVGGNIVYDDL